MVTRFSMMFGKMGRLIMRCQPGSGRVGSWPLAVLFLMLFALPSSRARPSDLSRDQILQMLELQQQRPEEEYAPAPVTVDETADYNEDSTGANKRYINDWNSYFFQGPSRRGRLSIGMTLDALSDLLYAERRKQYHEHATKAQQRLHNIGKRHVGKRH